MKDWWLVWRLARQIAYRKAKRAVPGFLLFVALALPLVVYYGPSLLVKLDFYRKYGLTSIGYAENPEHVSQVILSANVSIIIANLALFVFLRQRMLKPATK